MSELWYKSPAKDWESALPIGNGRLGAMIYGRTDTELLQLNESSVWYGGPQDRTPRDALKHLSQLRQLIRDGNHLEAEKLVRLAFFATPQSQRHYEPLGAATLEFGHDIKRARDYRRRLDLENAVTHVTYIYDGVRYSRETIASCPSEAIVMRLTATKSMDFVVRLTRVSEREYETNEFVDSIEAATNRIVMLATPGGQKSNQACCILAIQHIGEGSVNAVAGSLVVHAREVLLVIAARTTYKSVDPESLASHDVNQALQDMNLFSTHVEDYKSLYGRTSLRMSPDADHIATDERLLMTPDPGLISLYHNYGKYLLISCSRDKANSLPATLQGLWNPSFQPAWGSKYTININLQMNYWPANAWNLSQCEEPLFDLLERMAKNGEKTARVMYGCRGWAAHHNTDIWADTDPQDRWMPATLWPLGGAWLCTHVWERYEFGGDIDKLKRLFPILHGCILFILDFLVTDQSGQYLVTNPSLSPENSFLDEKSGTQGTLCEGSSIDIQIIAAILKQFQATCKALECDDELLSQVQRTLNRLPPHKIGSFGQLQEWQQDYHEVEPGHRHISHLWALHPGASITPSETPELASACSMVLKRRAEHGGGHTGWSRAWLINLHARLWQSKEALIHVQKLLMDSTLPNMLDTHPPFQIDGNFGGAAGIIEMLVQSVGGVIRFLPACPKELGEGSVSGIQCRGAFRVSFEWENGKLKWPVNITSLCGNNAAIFYGEDNMSLGSLPLEKGIYKVSPGCIMTLNS